MGGLGKARIPSKKKPKNGPGGTLRLIALQIDELGLRVPYNIQGEFVTRVSSVMHLLQRICA